MSFLPRTVYDPLVSSKRDIHIRRATICRRRRATIASVGMAVAAVGNFCPQPSTIVLTILLTVVTTFDSWWSKICIMFILTPRYYYLSVPRAAIALCVVSLNRRAFDDPCYGGGLVVN